MQLKCRMTTEREYKFLVAGVFPDPTLLEGRYRAGGLELHPRGVREQRDVYFDTPALTLLRAGVSLRQRRYEGQTFATFKGAGVVVNGLHVRGEIELPYTDRWPAEILDRLVSLGVTEQLGPLAELSARRERFLIVRSGETQAELTFDEVTGFEVTGFDVTSHTSHKEVQFQELELELFPNTRMGDLEALTAPLALPDLTPHAGDKLSHTLKLLGRL